MNEENALDAIIELRDRHARRLLEMNENKTIGKRIRKARKLRGMNRAQLADLVGYKSVSSLSMVERGLIDVGISKIYKIAVALGVDIDELICDRPGVVASDDGLFVTTADRYQHLSARTINNDTTQRDKLANFALGLGGEAGEVQNIIKKYLYHDHDSDVDELIDELGDVLWYVAAICTVAGVSMSDVMAANVAKLNRRYPDGFSSEASRNREGGE